MICSKCFKKIPAGEEVQKGSSFAWRAGWWGGGHGSEVVCKKCAQRQRKWERSLLFFFLIFATLATILPIVVIIATKATKK